MSDIATRAAVQAALRRADSIVGIGDVHGWPRPPGYSAALDMLNAARAAASDIPAAPPLPEKPAAVAKWATAAAEHRARESARGEVLDEAILRLERETADAGLAAGPAITARLIEHFAALVAEFDANSDAPRQLSGHESAEDLEAHASALRVVGGMALAVAQRIAIADVAGENEDIGPDLVWTVLAPRGDSTRNGIESVLGEFKNRIPQDLSEWDQLLAAANLALAGLGKIGARRQRYTDYLYVSGTQTMDLGQRGDHTFAEIENLENASRNSRIMQRETDRIFEQAEPMSLS